MGLLVAGVPSNESMVRRVAALKGDTDGRWVAVVASKELAVITEEHLKSIDDQATNATLEVAFERRRQRRGVDEQANAGAGPLG